MWEDQYSRGNARNLRLRVLRILRLCTASAIKSRYYYYGMACPVDWPPGTVLYSDAIRRTVGSCQCSSASACPDPPTCSEGNCFKPDGRIIQLNYEVARRPSHVVVPPAVSKKVHPKIPPQCPPIILTPCSSPGFTATLVGNPWFARLHLPKGKTIIAKLQKVRIVAAANGLPENLKGETMIGHGAQVTAKPEGPIQDIPPDKIQCVSPDPETASTSVVIVNYDDTCYIVLLADPIECTPAKADDL